MLKEVFDMKQVAVLDNPIAETSLSKTLLSEFGPIAKEAAPKLIDAFKDINVAHLNTVSKLLDTTIPELLELIESCASSAIEVDSQTDDFAKDMQTLFVIERKIIKKDTSLSSSKKRAALNSLAQRRCKYQNQIQKYKNCDSKRKTKSVVTIIVATIGAFASGVFFARSKGFSAVSKSYMRNKTTRHGFNTVSHIFDRFFDTINHISDSLFDRAKELIKSFNPFHEMFK